MILRVDMTAQCTYTKEILNYYIGFGGQGLTL